MFTLVFVIYLVKYTPSSITPLAVIHGFETFELCEVAAKKLEHDVVDDTIRVSHSCVRMDK